MRFRCLRIDSRAHVASFIVSTSVHKREDVLTILVPPLNQIIPFTANHRFVLLLPDVLKPAPTLVSSKYVHARH